MANQSFLLAFLLLAAGLIAGLGARVLVIVSTGGFEWKSQKWQFITAAFVGLLVAFLLAWVGLKGWFGFVLLALTGFFSYYWMSLLSKKKGG
jgi:hypothetical protein